MKEKREWLGDEALACPLCVGRGRATAETGNTNNAHVSEAWVDDTRLRTIRRGESQLLRGPSQLPSYGSGVGLVCFFEQCEHVVEYRLRFHKGEVLLEWSFRGTAEIGASEFGELPRS